MAFELPPGSEIIPIQDELWCRMYSETNVIPDLPSGVNLIKPDQAKRQVFFARVVRVGPGRMADISESGDPIRMPMLFSEGDDVLFGRFHGEPVTVGKDQFIILKQDDILAKVKIPDDVQGIYYELAGKGKINEESLEAGRIIG